MGISILKRQYCPFYILLAELALTKSILKILD
jgi:hypothetical protein